MIDNENRILHIGDKLYYIYWEVLDNKPVWVYATYTILDMYYSNNCYVVIEDEFGETKELMMNHKNLIRWFYTEDEAKAQIKKEQNTPRSYAWGNMNHLDKEYSEVNKVSEIG